MPGHVWYPPSGDGPGLVVVQEIFGISDYIRRRCADLAALGYVVLAPELYWRVEDAEIDESAPDMLEKAVALSQQLDWDTAVADVRAALETVRSICTNGVGLIGFCFGGGLAFNVAALDPPDVLVSYYGSALPQLLHLAPQVQVPSLHHFGTADAYIDMDSVGRIREAVTTNPYTEFLTYPGAGHAFDNPHPQFHHAEASEEAWKATIEFLRTQLHS